MIAKGIMCLALVALVVSCKSSSVPRISQMDTDRHESHLLHRVDTIYRHDSIYIREVQKGDTVYLTRVEWRDRWRTQLVHDTVVRTDSIVQVVEHPPEKYVPKFYKRCTWALWAIIMASLAYIILRWYLRR